MRTKITALVQKAARLSSLQFCSFSRISTNLRLTSQIQCYAFPLSPPPNPAGRRGENQIIKEEVGTGRGMHIFHHFFLYNPTRGVISGLPPSREPRNNRALKGNLKELKYFTHILFHSSFVHEMHTLMRKNYRTFCKSTLATKMELV